MVLRDADDAEAMHFLPPGAAGELCETAGDIGTSVAADVTCRECVNEVINGVLQATSEHIDE